MALMPRGRSYLMPSGSIARLFRKHNGTHGVAVKSAPAELDIAASRAGDKVFLHVANIHYNRAVEASFPGTRGGRVIEIAPENLRSYLNQDQPDAFRPREIELKGVCWRFPAGSVSAVELELSAEALAALTNFRERAALLTKIFEEAHLLRPASCALFYPSTVKLTGEKLDHTDVSFGNRGTRNRPPQAAFLWRC